MAKKQILEYEYDFDFQVIGIVSSQAYYRLCWSINKGMGFFLRRSDDLEVPLQKKQEDASFTFFEYEDKNGLSYFLVSNKSSGALLIPELKSLDYLLIIKGALDQLKPESFIASLKNVEFVETVIPVDHLKLKSKQNLIF